MLSRGWKAESGDSVRCWPNAGAHRAGDAARQIGELFIEMLLAHGGGCRPPPPACPTQQQAAGGPSL
jgi:hypothetical protein